MKKILTIVLCLILAINCSALSVVDTTYSYNIDDTHITIEFAAGSAFSDEKQQQIANHMVYGDNNVSTYALCWLTGHNYVTEGVTLIEHKVYALSPRCVQRIYSVKTCSKCDFIEETLVAQTPIVCCPEN